jgi:hypothetical protein
LPPPAAVALPLVILPPPAAVALPLVILPPPAAVALPLVILPPPAAVALPLVILPPPVCACTSLVYSAIVKNAVNNIDAVITNGICLYIRMLTPKKYIRVVSNLFIYDDTYSYAITYLFISILISCLLLDTFSEYYHFGYAEI